MFGFAAFSGAGAEKKRKRLHDKVAESPLRDYLSVPFPSGDSESLPLLAIDLETTGLNPKIDHVLSIGFVPVNGVRIDLSGARQLIVRAQQQVGQSAVVHGLTDDALACGVDLRDAVATALRALSGRVLLAHHAEVERAFLNAACREIYGAAPVFSIVDTLLVQARLNRVEPESAPPGSLRLTASRDRFGLPRYRAHEALTDALACAELYLAQVAELGQGQSISLKTLQTN